MKFKKTKKATKLEFQPTTRESAEHRTWFRGEHTNLLPGDRHLFQPGGVDRFVLSGWKPKEPIISASSQVTAFGSCFAANISNWLAKRSYTVLNKSDGSSNSYVVQCGEGMVNSFVILQQFEWAWENKTFDLELWHGYDTKAYGYDPEIQAQTKKMFDETDVFILTFGLSEVWYDEPTGNVFWRTIPKESYDAERHKFRVTTVEENKDNMRAIYDLIRKHRPDAKIIFTLSPIPLQATFRPNSCITSSSVSKSILRTAIDEVVREKADDGVLHYWPSYELVTDVFQMPFKHDRRHVKEDVLDYIMMLFEQTWCSDTQLSDEDMVAGFVTAGATAGLFPGVLARICKRKNTGRLEKLLEREALLSEPREDKALRALLGVLQKHWQSSQSEAA